MIINWCLVAIVALIIGGICSVIEKDGDYFLVAVIFDFFIGLGYYLTIL